RSAAPNAGAPLTAPGRSGTRPEIRERRACRKLCGLNVRKSPEHIVEDYRVLSTSTHIYGRETERTAESDDRKTCLASSLSVGQGKLRIPRGRLNHGHKSYRC